MMVRASHVGSIIPLARNGLHRGTAQKAVMSVPGIFGRRGRNPHYRGSGIVPMDDVEARLSTKNRAQPRQ
jgi:hypothetical protein